MHLDNSEMPVSRKDPRGFVVTMCLAIFVLTWVAVIVTQLKMPML